MILALIFNQSSTPHTHTVGKFKSIYFFASSRHFKSLKIGWQPELKVWEKPFAQTEARLCLEYIPSRSKVAYWGPLQSITLCFLFFHFRSPINPDLSIRVHCFWSSFFPSTLLVYFRSDAVQPVDGVNSANQSPRWPDNDSLIPVCTSLHDKPTPYPASRQWLIPPNRKHKPSIIQTEAFRT